LAVLGQNNRGNLRVLLDQLEDRVGKDIRASVGEVHESLEARIRLAQHTVAVARNDTSRLQGAPEVVTDVVVGELGADLILHGQDPAEDLLGGKAVQRAGQTQQTGAVAEVRVAESAANQVGGVGRDIATLVVTVQSKVQSQQVVEVLVLLTTLAEQLGKVVGP